MMAAVLRHCNRLFLGSLLLIHCCSFSLLLLMIKLKPYILAAAFRGPRIGRLGTCSLQILMCLVLRLLLLLL